MLHNDVLIESNKYGCDIVQNNGTMKIVNFTHVQMAETGNECIAETLHNALHSLHCNAWKQCILSAIRERRIWG